MTHPVTRDGETSGHAITALVFAVLGWLVLPILGPVIALVYASRARRQVERDPSMHGEGLITAARTISLVQLVLLLFAVVVGLAFGIAYSVRSDEAAPSREPAQISPTEVSTTSPAVEGQADVLVSSRRLVALTRSLEPPSAPLAGVYAVRSISDYVWADGGPEHTRGTLRLNLSPAPRHDSTLVRLMIFDNGSHALDDLSTAAGNFGADNIGLDPSIGRPGACWTQDGSDVCELLYGRVLVEARSPSNTHRSLKIAQQVVRWLGERLPAEDSLTAEG